MSLRKAFLSCDEFEGKWRVQHNCDGGLGFCAEDNVDEKTARLILLAIEEGKRRRSKEITDLLSWKGMK
jgi:hypothetical protein